MFVDSHAHLDQASTKGAPDEFIVRALEADVSKIAAIGGGLASNRETCELAERYPDLILPVVGYDRDEAQNSACSLCELQQYLLDYDICAIGETGLDYHYSPETRSEQINLFESMLELAAGSDLPVVVHARDADEDMLSMLQNYVSGSNLPEGRRGVIHCFTGTLEFAQQALALGFCISFSGIVTFRNASALREVIPHVPLDRMLIETDTPYLSPEPMRGKTNEPGRLPYVAACVADVLGCTVEDVAHSTAEAALRLFSRDQKYEVNR